LLENLLGPKPTKAALRYFPGARPEISLRTGSGQLRAI
jgi:hypothetical protein